MTHSRIKTFSVWIFALGMLAIAIFALVKQASPPVQAPALPVPSAPVIAEAQTSPKPLPANEFPAQKPEKPVPTTALPPLDASDLLASHVLSEALRAPTLPSLLIPEKLIRRFVASVDNLPRRQGSQKLFPFHEVPGLTKVEGVITLTLSQENGARYSSYVSLLEQLDAVKAVDAYVGIYPLLQQAYEELGYPGKRFNDRVFEAIDDLLDAPEPQTSVTLIQPKVLYKYADEDLESRTTGQKIMIRIGVENERRVKRVFERIRNELLRRVSDQGIPDGAH